MNDIYIDNDKCMGEHKKKSRRNPKYIKRPEREYERKGRIFAEY